MEQHTVRDCRILVVEDEFMLADEITAELIEAGANVVGPAATVRDAVALINSDCSIDVAVLDANLRGEMVFPAAGLLLKLGAPFVFSTGYDASAFPARFNHITRCEKPTSIKRVIKAIGRAIHA